MPTSSATFDDQIARWKQEMDLPWAKLKYKLVRANLAKHLRQNQMRILDAGSGNGLESISFAKEGHFVDLVDYSREMLADAQQVAAKANVEDHIAIHQADINSIHELFPDTQFDLILFHNVLQYIEDLPGTFKNLSKLLKPEGVISIVSINRYSTPYYAAFLEGDLAKALTELESRTSNAKIFDAIMTSYSAEEISKMLEENGIIHEKDYGIRCLCDYWGDNERKRNPMIFEQIERLEFALTDRYPYKLLARYFQVVARKTKASTYEL